MKEILVVLALVGALFGWFGGGEKTDKDRKVEEAAKVAATVVTGNPITGEVVGGAAALLMAVLRFATRGRPS